MKLTFLKFSGAASLLLLSLFDPQPGVGHPVGRMTLQQTQEIGGVVQDIKGNPLPGVTVALKGSKRGTQTNANGVFHLAVQPGEVLVFSFVGYVNKEVTVGSDRNVTVVLEEQVRGLSEFVVTALGIQRKPKELTYATQQVKGADLSQVKETNVVNSLVGKVSGLQVSRSASGVAGSARVILRGQKSIRENQPLYVVDGVPMVNFTAAQPTDIWGQASGTGSSGRDGGDILSTINPEDIDNINVLKGASASALYGSQAANGVIMISTKKGKSGHPRINYSSNFTLDQAAYRPDLQYEFNQSSEGSAYSWGAKGNNPDHVKPFFRTGNTWINAINLSTGSDQAQTYFSYSNTTNKGILPTSTFNQHTINIRETAQFLDGKLSMDANVLMTTQKSHNRATSGLYYNPLSGLYLFPRGLNFDSYKTYEKFSPVRNTYLQRWWNIDFDNNMAGLDIQQNPYWVLNRNITENTKDNLLASLQLRYQLTDWLYLQARGNVNKAWDKYELKANASTQTTLADKNGRYTFDKFSSTQYYGDLLLVGNRKLSQRIGLNFTLGTSITDLKQEREFIDSKGSGPGLVAANVFHIGNVVPTNAATIRPTGVRRQLQSVFATAGLNLDEKVFLDLTARNDWSSTLAYTPDVKKGYLYYSAGINAILHELLQLPSFIDYSKIRFSYARVGNDVQPFATLPTNTFVSGVLTSNTSGPYLNRPLKPEVTQSIEAGMEWRMLHNRLSFDATWYQSYTQDQYFDFLISVGFLYPNVFINAGKIQNSGVEATLSYDVVKKHAFSWQTTLNFTHNKNKIIHLAEQLKGDYLIGPKGVNVNNYSLRIREGSSYGDIYGRRFQRAADGSILVDNTGKPLQEGGPLAYLGNPTPKFLLGWGNNFNWKNLTFSFLIDGRFGGKVMSITQAMLDEYGVSQVTADARNNGGVSIDASKTGGGKFTDKIPAEIFYRTVGGRAGITEYYMYDATNIRLRELAIGYNIPLTSKVVKDLKVGLVGRNLFFFTKKAPYDPEISMSTDNGLQGVDVFSLPATRSFGLSVRCSL